MKRLMKIIGILVVALMLVAGGVLVAAKVLISPERIRQLVVSMAEDHLKRPVSIGDIQVRIFSGIAISDFVIRSNDGADDFVSADALVLRYQFWPLLRFSVVIDEVRLESPQILIERYQDDTFNFSDLLAEKTSRESENREISQEPADESTAGLPVDLLVKEISISGGRLVFVDQMVNHEYQLGDLMLSLSGVSLSGPVPFDLSAKINDAPLDIGGTIDFGKMHALATIRAQNLDVSAFMPYAQNNFPGKVSSLTLSMDIRAEADQHKIDSSGQISLTDMSLSLDDMPEIPVENARVTLDYDFGMDLVSDNLIVTRADADINGIQLFMSGNILSFSNNPVLDITLRLPVTSVSDLMASAPRKLVKPVLEMQPQGQIGAQIYLKGSPDQPENLIEKATVVLEKTGVAIGQLTPEISGNISIVKDTASSDNLVIRAAGDSMRMEFTAKNLMGEVIRVDHTIVSERLNVDRLLASMDTEKKEPSKPSDKKPDKAQEPGPFNIPALVKGEIRIDDAIFYGMNVANFEVQYLLRENVLTVSQLGGDVAGGTLSGTARAELNRKPLVYTADISVEQTRAEDIVNTLFPGASNTVFGTMFLKSDIRGQGITSETILKTLTSRTDVNIANGKLTGTGLAGGLAGFLNTRRLEVLEFDSLKGNVKLEDGKIKLNSQFTGDQIRMAPTGTIGLDGSLNLSLDMRLAPSLASNIQIGSLYSRLAQTDDGWTLLPLGVAGTLKSPRFNLDTSSVSEQIKKRGEEEIRKQLQDKVLEKLDPQGILEGIFDTGK